MNKKIFYITYQSFPAETANSLQSISNIVEIVRRGYDLTLIFPNREKLSSSNISDFKKFYNFSENFKIMRLSHPLPFSKFKYFKKITFHISHFLWAFFVIKFNKKLQLGDLYITRSDWIFYFLSKKGKNVTFECHTESKLRSILLKSSIKNRNSKVVFITNSLKSAFAGLDFLPNQDIVLESGFRGEFFTEITKKTKKEVIFVGNLLRFGKTRDIEFVIECFMDARLKDHTLKIVGGPEKYTELLKKTVEELGATNIQIMGYMNQQRTAAILMKAETGILINSKENNNSLLHTSPLKYFEYLAANLNIVAVDFQSHRNLPMVHKINFFESGNKNQFIETVLKFKSSPTFEKSMVEEFSYKERVGKLLQFARLEGLEPPTL